MEQSLRRLGEERRRTLDDSAVPPSRLAHLLDAFMAHRAERETRDGTAWVERLGELWTDLFDVSLAGGVSAVRGPGDPGPIPECPPSGLLTIEVRPRMGRAAGTPRPIVLIGDMDGDHFYPVPCLTMRPGPRPGWLSIALDASDLGLGPGVHDALVMLQDPTAPDVPAPPEGLAWGDLDPVGIARLSFRVSAGDAA